MKYILKNTKETDKKVKEAKYKRIIGLIVPIVIVIGHVNPLFGLTIFGCMLGALLLSLYKGRIWCGKMCPRGAFLDAYISLLSKNKKIPKIMKAKWFKISIIILLLFLMTINFIRSNGNVLLFGECMVRLLLITTVIAIALGIIYKPRTWCSICPMGTLSGLIGKKNRSLLINKNNCVGCKLCNKKCLMEVKVYKYKDIGKVIDANCIKCGQCVNVCPKEALQQ